MLVIRDEQVIASIYLIFGYRKIAGSFLDFFNQVAKAVFASFGIFWYHSLKVAKVATKYPNYFSLSGNLLTILKDQKEMYEAFLATLPSDAKTVLATVTKDLCKG